jgi:hypothetical protein
MAEAGVTLAVMDLEAGGDAAQAAAVMVPLEDLAA